MSSDKFQNEVDVTDAATGLHAKKPVLHANEVESEDGKDMPADYFLSQLKDLTDSITTSFDSIGNTIDDLRVKMSTLTSLSTSLLDPVLPINGESKFNDKVIDSRLMLLELAQQAQDGLKAREDDHQQSSSPQGYIGGFSHHILPRRLDSSSLDLPEIDLNPRAKTVPDVWEEWEHGYRGQKPLRDLEQRYGTRWRRGRIAKSAQRRKKLIEFVESEKKRFNSKTIDQVVQDLEQYRIQKGKGLFWLYSQLPEQLYDVDGKIVFTDYDEPYAKKQKTEDLGAVAAAAIDAKNNEDKNDDVEPTTDPALANMGRLDEKKK